MSKDKENTINSALTNTPLMREDAQNNELLIRLKNMIDALPGDVYCKDINGIWTSINKHCVASLYRMGFIKEPKEEEVLGKTDYDLFDKATADGYRLNDLEVIHSQRKLTLEETTLLPNGSHITLLSTKSPFVDKNNQVLGIIGNSFDITERKQMEGELHQAKEKAEAANRAKTSFLENMRHDIRTPLSGIVGFAELIKLQADTPKLQEYATSLIASSNALLKLLDEVFEAVRISSGEIPHVRKKFNLYQMMQQVIDLNHAKALSKQLNLSLNWDNTLPHYVIGDKVRVHRIILELIANALNFTDFGEVHVLVRCAKKSNRNIIIEFRIKDTGIGIPQDKQKDLYVQFNRLSPAFQSHYKGIGLGLSVVKQFIEELEGEIYVESKPQEGTCFICIVPFKVPLINDDVGCDQDKAPNEVMPAKRPHQHIDANTYRILVVEDNFLAQMVTQSLLTHFQCAVDIADTGAKALDLAAQHQYDMIFMDVGLPDMEGYEVTRTLREIKADKILPIIGLSAHVDEEHQQRALEVGMTQLLIKPLTVELCEQLIQHFILNKNPPRGTYNPPSMDEDASLLDLSAFPTLNIEAGIKSTGSEELLTQMLRFMLKETLDQDVALMKQAHEAQDWEATQRFAHKIKGGAVYLGTVKMKMACDHLEQYWKAGKKQLLEPLYQQVLSTVEETLHEINDYLIKKSVIKKNNAP